MSDKSKSTTARPPPLFPASRPEPGIPSRFAAPHQSPRKGNDDPISVRLAEIEAKRLEDELKLAELEAKRAEDQIKLAELELKLRLAEQQSQAKESLAPRSQGVGFVLQIKDWDKATKFIVAITALISAFSLALGLKNNADKAPKPEVKEVANEVKEVKRVMTGETDLKGASSEGEDVVSQIKALRGMVSPLVASSCPHAQWLKAVFARAKPPIYVQLPEGCPDNPSIVVEINEDSKPPKALRVPRPMPAP